MKIYFVVIFCLCMCSGCNDDPLGRLSRSLNHGRKENKNEEPKCRRCGMELSKPGNCTDMSCPFFKMKQNCLTDKEKAFISKSKALYASIRHDDEAEKYRDLEVEKIDKECCMCKEKTSRVVLCVFGEDREIVGPFRCCSVECEQLLLEKIPHEKTKR